MKLIFLGPPGSGKGTYASRVAPVLKIITISTGELFREIMKQGTEIGLKAKSFIDQGKLVPDEITVEILKQRIKQKDAKNGFILDGFPRTIPQADALEKIVKIDAVINIFVPDDILIARLTSRRQCRKCSEIYNILNIRPKKEGICDKCGGELYQRDDDKIEVIKKRLDVYKNQTKPLIDYYRKKELIIDIQNNNINTPPEPIVKEILDKLKNVKIK